MRTKIGQFRQDDYNKYNDLSIKKVSDYLIKKGFNVPYKAEDYDIDIIAYKNNIEYRIEVEVRTKLNWTSEKDYPYSTVSFLGRKEKYCKSKDFWYFLVSNDINNFLFCKSNYIFNTQYQVVKQVDTNKRYGVDIVYHIPKQLCNFRAF
tara:strand:- start:466 stop:912 length:447 start_codon:yes stop_codon:yes gene_type:complete